MLFFVFPLLLATALAADRSTAPVGAIVVASSGGDYTTIQAAVDALDTTTTTAQSIFISTGTYKEQVSIPALSSELTIYGQTTDTTGYAQNTVTVSQGLSQDNVSSNDLTATLRNKAENTNIYNINFENTRGEGSQALAVSAAATKQGYYGCQFLGFQDTVLANEGAQVYAKSLIQGATDFIFGQRAKAWFDSVDIKLLSAKVGYITANGRSAEDGTDGNSYYVIHKSTVNAADGQTVNAGAYYLGRPWRNYSRVVFQETSLSDAINSEGWSVWSTTTPNTEHVLFGEYANTGDGAAGTRASFATALTAAVDITEILGADYSTWVDTSYLA